MTNSAAERAALTWGLPPDEMVCQPTKVIRFDCCQTEFIHLVNSVVGARFVATCDGNGDELQMGWRHIGVEKSTSGYDSDKVEVEG